MLHHLIVLITMFSLTLARLVIILIYYYFHAYDMQPAFKHATTVVAMTEHTSSTGLILKIIVPSHIRGNEHELGHSKDELGS